MHSIKETLGKLVLEGLQFLQTHQTESLKKIVRIKGPGNIATEADHEVESYLTGQLMKQFPEIPVLSEEADKHLEESDRLFIVDPLDGSTNFHRGLTHYSVNIALMKDGEPIVAAAAVGESQEVFTAIKGEGTWLNDIRIKTDPTGLSPLSMVALQSHHGDGTFPLREWLYRNGGKIRNYGSVVSHICQIACQRFDLFVAQRMKIWDVAAPALILLEAGGAFVDFHGNSLFPMKRVDMTNKDLGFEIIASNGKAHQDIPEEIWAGLRQ
ncbi:MAG: inositol monophosphatase family protein [Planctomycetota bacterium]